MQFGAVKLKACKYGWMLFSGEFIGKCFDLYGQYSESEVALMRDFLKEGDVAIDIGANIGDLTLPLSRIVGETGRIYAVESNPQIFNILCANLALNAIVNTKPLNVYIAMADQSTPETGSWGKSAYMGNTWEPNYMALDALDISRCDMIKVDVDGAELAVLKSGEMLIEKHRPIVYFENDQRALSQPLLDYVMHKLGYDLYRHTAPIFELENFFGNPTNHWAPDNIVSMMVLGIPTEQKRKVTGLPKISSPDEWPDN